MKFSRWYLWLGAPSAILTILLLMLQFIDEPMRAYSERQLNQLVEGYQCRIGAVEFHVIGLSLEVRDITIRQTENTDLPVMHIDRWDASIYWKALLQGNVVSDHLFERPTLYLTKRQAEQEFSHHVPVKDAGWQQAVMAIYPVKINQLRIRDGSFLYRENANATPVQFTRINFTAENIRNVRARENELPSEFHMEATLLESGYLTMDGRADFLREPHLAFQGDISIQEMPVKKLLPLTQPRTIEVTDGVLSATGRLIYAPELHELHVDALLIQNLKAALRYLNQPAPATVYQGMPHTETIGSTPHQPDNSSDPVKWSFHLVKGAIEHGELGFINSSTHPPYRLVVSDVNLSLFQWTNQESADMSKMTVKGLFMGKGVVEGDVTFRPAAERPDFAVRLKLLRTPLKTINAFLRAHGSIDVVAGSLSVFSEMTVRHGHVTGYIKPLLKDVDVYDPNQDKDKSLWETFLEKLSDVAVDVLRNQPRKEVATKAGLSGQISHPQANTWEIVWKLIQNAFFDAILPGLEGKKSEKKL